MPKIRPPILKKALDFFTISIPMEKFRKTISRDVLIFKKTRKIRTLKFQKHYSYTYLEEYQFSPPSTPLFNYPRISFKKRSRQRLCSMLLCHCLGNSSSEEGGAHERDAFEVPVAFDDTRREPESWQLSEEEEAEEESDSVDRRAEKFIERFYEEIRMQRQESSLEYAEMLDRSIG